MVEWLEYHVKPNVNFATRALEYGMDVKTLAEILGHKNPNITLLRYSHSMAEHKRSMMNILGQLFING